VALCSVLGCGEEIPKDLDETPSIVVTDPPTGCKGECALKFDKCGGARLPVSKPCCEEGTACVVKDLYYAQCLTPEDAEKLIGWDGRFAFFVTCLSLTDLHAHLMEHEQRILSCR
jgi:hypothetical protein